MPRRRETGTSSEPDTIDELLDDREAEGLPRTIEDPDVLRTVASTVARGEREGGHRGAA